MKEKELCYEQDLCVSEEVRQELEREKWREKQRKYRAKKCRDVNGVVCRKDCKTCPFYLQGNPLTGETLSLESLTDEDGNPVEFEDKQSDVEREVGRRILSEFIYNVKSQLNKREQLILTYFMEERSDAEIGESLHISKSGAREARYRLFAKLRIILSSFSDYFQK